MRAEGSSKNALKQVWQHEGVKGLPCWSRLEYWNWAEDMLQDGMHQTKNNVHRARVMLGAIEAAPDAIKQSIKMYRRNPRATSVRTP